MNWVISNDRIVAAVSGIWVELISLKSGNFVLKISFMENYSWEWSLFHHWVLIFYEYRCQKFAWLSLTFSEPLTKTDKSGDIVHYQYTTGLWKIMWKWASLMVWLSLQIRLQMIEIRPIYIYWYISNILTIPETEINVMKYHFDVFFCRKETM